MNPAGHTTTRHSTPRVKRHKPIQAGLRVPGAVPVVLPARLGAQRFPGKLLTPFGGTHALELCVSTALAAELGPVSVISGDAALLDEARRLGVGAIEVAEGANGSERIAAAISRGALFPSDDGFVLNLQADAVGVLPHQLRAAVDALREDERAALATVAVRAPRSAHQGRTTVVESGGRALWFSRCALPHDRDGRESPILLHLGLYAYRADALLRIWGRPPGPAEQAEHLEQLRALEQHQSIALRVADDGPEAAFAIDRPEDLPFAEALLANHRNNDKPDAARTLSPPEARSRLP